MYESPIREVLVTGGKTYTDVSNDICRPLENKPTKGWWFGFIISALVLGLWLGATTYTLMRKVCYLLMATSPEQSGTQFSETQHQHIPVIKCGQSL